MIIFIFAFLKSFSVSFLFINPLVMKYYNVLAYFSLDYENCPFYEIKLVDYFADILYLSNTNKLHDH